MARRLTDEERIEQYFSTQPQDKCITQQDRISLVMRVRFKEMAPVKRGRPKTKKQKPPISDGEDLSDNLTGKL